MNEKEKALLVEEIVEKVTAAIDPVIVRLRDALHMLSRAGTVMYDCDTHGVSMQPFRDELTAFLK